MKRILQSVSILGFEQTNIIGNVFSVIYSNIPCFDLWQQLEGSQNGVDEPEGFITYSDIQGGSNMTWTDFFCNHNCSSLYQLPDRTEQVLTRAGGRVEVVTSHSQGRTAAAQCNLFTHKSVPVIFEPSCISNKMQRYTVYLFLETALHVSGGISTHHQEHKQLYLQHLVLVKP